MSGLDGEGKALVKEALQPCLSETDSGHHRPPPACGAPTGWIGDVSSTSGPHDALIARRGLYAHLWEGQQLS